MHFQSKRAEIPRPSKSAPAPAAWCPFAKIVEPPMPTQGPYTNLYPLGAVVHYTASAQGSDEIAYGRKMGYAYMLITREGQLYQAHPLTRWGYHAGPSEWPGLGSGVSRHLVGIELEAAGLLTDKGDTILTWYGNHVLWSEARLVAAAVDNQQKGLYHIYTAAQETALTRLLFWMKRCNPTVFDFNLVLGHDEVAPTRKQDPGGALSMTMPKYREYLKATWEATSDHG
jgi:N-acetyl-anhydromuramyl-L-alanine amidase AmpD